MAGRIRTIKPELLEDSKTAGLDDACWRLFVSLIILADDYGNFRADPPYLRGEVWSHHVEEVTLKDVADRFAVLVTKGLVLGYSVRAQAYGHLNGWEKHQRVSRPGARRVPAPPNSGVVSGEVSGLISDLRSPITDPDLEAATADRAKTKKPLPDSWAPHDAHRAKALHLGIDLDLEAEKFRNHAGTVDRRCVDWNKAFFNWLVKAWEMREERNPKPKAAEPKGKTFPGAKPPPPWFDR